MKTAGSQVDDTETCEAPVKSDLCETGLLSFPITGFWLSVDSLLAPTSAHWF